MGSVAFAAGCNSHPEKNLYALVRAPEDMVTGEPLWYASTCRECPAGCGVLAKSREGRVIKLEGNPLHPVNQGKLCARGQAALQGVYNPDRIRTPLLMKNGRWEAIAEQEALAVLRQRLAQSAANGPGRVAVVTESVGDSLLELLKQVLGSAGAQKPLIFEPFAFESLKHAHAQVFGQPVLPGYHMEQCDLLIGFGADFLETWLSPVAYAHKFKAMHALTRGHKNMFLHVGPYLSLTGANADRWIACRPGAEPFVLMGLIRHAMAIGRGRDLPTPLRSGLDRVASAYKPETVAELADITPETFEFLSRRLQAARKPFILGAGTAAGGPADLAVDLAAVLLNTILDPELSLYDFNRRHRIETAATRSDLAALWKQAAQGQTDVLLLNNVNPVYNLPPGMQSAEVLGRGDVFVAAFTDFMDETAAAADLIIPVQLPLETWDAYEGTSDITSTLQPAMGPITPASSTGDLLLQLVDGAKRPAADYRTYLQQRLVDRLRIASQEHWLRLIQTGGRFAGEQPADRWQAAIEPKAVFVLEDLLSRAREELQASDRLYVTPSLRFFDGRGANKPWLPEIPDPVTQIAWQSTVMVSSQTMAARGWSDGDLLRVETSAGRVELPAYAHPGLHARALLVAMGQGHADYGRYARQQGVNPTVLLDPTVDPQAGAPLFCAEVTLLESTGARLTLASTSGSRDQYGRKIALNVPLKDARKPPAEGKGLAMHDFPLTLPLPEGYSHHRDFYPAHDHDTYRWGMAVDLDRCIGCSACVAACYAENNVGVVGEQRIVQGREMAWLRIERYEDSRNPARLIFLPMMCQHCDNAPCESVCPVYAPHHSKEGLNNQIYNRCIGTRFCAQNCPYKVRRFNWFDWQWPEPLNQQLNPNVTFRSKGVMEKCSFCVQRIKQAHNLAKNENRLIADGEIQPACVQTCPTDALHFGNLMDPASRVRKMVSDPRAYQVMGYLNTKPAVIYLKKVIHEI
jgi:molybdopterin-containing oxidoreductase family iron-sulfur binding subunit